MSGVDRRRGNKAIFNFHSTKSHPVESVRQLTVLRWKKERREKEEGERKDGVRGRGKKFDWFWQRDGQGQKEVSIYKTVRQCAY